MRADASGRGRVDPERHVRSLLRLLFARRRLRSRLVGRKADLGPSLARRVLAGTRREASW